MQLESRRGRSALTVAHRGFSAIQPENTLPAFSAALPFSDYIETDVRATADQVPILMHDATLRRTTDVARVFPSRADDPVESFTAEQIGRLQAGSWFDAAHDAVPVPTLRHGLELLAGTHCGLLLELKAPVEELVQAVLRDFRAEHPQFPVAVASIKVGIARRLHELLPDLPVGVLFLDQDVLTAAQIADYASFCRFLAFRNDRLRPETVERVHRAGLQILHNTNTRAAMRECAGYGADGTVTDNPEAKDAVSAGRTDRSIEAEDLRGGARGTARAARRARDELTIPYKLSGAAALAIQAGEAGEWVEVVVPLDRPALVRCAFLTGPGTGTYDVSWDGEPAARVEGYSRSPGRRSVLITTAGAGSHHLRFTCRGADPAATDRDLLVDVIDLIAA